MYNEVLKIIEGGMNNDRQKVINYSRVLAEYYSTHEQINVAKKILRLVEENNTSLSSLDSFTTKPFDNESKLEIVDVTVPHESEEVLIFSEKIENEVRDFVLSYMKKDELLALGIESNNHMLLYGPPGTGKSSLAKYVSVQLDIPLVTARLDSLVSSMLGSTSKNIRKIFDYAAKQPCVLFLDEFDVIAKVRDDKNELGELKRVVNSLIQNIDSFDKNSILIAATNHPQLLDSAIWRRFDKTIMLNYPDTDARKELIINFSSILPNDFVEENKKLDILIATTENLSPSIIKSIINTAAKKSILASKENLSFLQVLYEIFLIKNPSELTDEKLIIFLHESGVSQKEIREGLNFPTRKVRNTLQKER